MKKTLSVEKKRRNSRIAVVLLRRSPARSKRMSLLKELPEKKPPPKLKKKRNEKGLLSANLGSMSKRLSVMLRKIREKSVSARIRSSWRGLEPKDNVGLRNRKS